jgi:hypothetical protein
MEHARTYFQRQNPAQQMEIGAVIFLLTLTLSIWLIVSAEIFMGYSDAQQYILQVALIDQGTYWRSNPFLDAYAPIFPILTSALYIPSILSPFESKKYFNLAISMLSVIPTYGLICKIIQRTPFRLIALFFVLFNADIIIYSIFPMSTGLLIFCVASFFYLLTERRYALAWIFAVLAFLNQFTFGIHLPVQIFYSGFVAWREPHLSVKEIFVKQELKTLMRKMHIDKIIGISVAILLPFFIRNLNIAGSFMPTSDIGFIGRQHERNHALYYLDYFSFPLFAQIHVGLYNSVSLITIGIGCVIVQAGIHLCRKWKFARAPLSSTLARSDKPPAILTAPTTPTAPSSNTIDPNSNKCRQDLDYLLLIMMTGTLIFITVFFSFYFVIYFDTRFILPVYWMVGPLIFSSLEDILEQNPIITPSSISKRLVYGAAGVIALCIAINQIYLLFSLNQHILII